MASKTTKMASQVNAKSSTVTAVGDTTTATTLIAANPHRLGGGIYNTSTAILYVLFANTGTVSASLFSVKLDQDDYVELPYGWEGRVTGVWASDAGGSAMVTEFTS